MRLIHLSDLHFSAHTPDLPDRLRHSIRAAQPDLVVVSGDLSQRGRERELVAAREFLDSIPHPLLVVPGNHDVQGAWMFWERFLRPLSNYRRVVTQDLEPVWFDKHMIVLGLNSVRPYGPYCDWSRGSLSSHQVARMSELFGDAHRSLLRVVVLHHPPAAPPHGTARHLLGRLREFTAAINQAGVDLVLSGHFHMSYAQALPLAGPPYPRSCVLSSASTAISHRLKGEVNGFHVIEGNALHLTISDHAWDGTGYRHRRSWHFIGDSAIRHWEAHASSVA